MDMAGDGGPLIDTFACLRGATGIKKCICPLGKCTQDSLGIERKCPFSIPSGGWGQEGTYVGLL